MRAVGFMLGAVLGIALNALLLWWLGVATWVGGATGSSNDASDEAIASAAPVHAPMPVELIDLAAALPDKRVLPPPAAVASADADGPGKDTDDASLEPLPQQHSYAIWRPFSSRIAAQGFADAVAERSGMTVEVRPKDAERFEVVLSYRDEQELAAMLRTIEDATRLQLR